MVGGSLELALDSSVHHISSQNRKPDIQNAGDKNKNYFLFCPVSQRICGHCCGKLANSPELPGFVYLLDF